MDRSDRSLVLRAAQSSVASLFVARARAHPSRIAIREGDRAISYAALEARVARLATHLLERGLRAGDRIAVLSENRTEYLEAFLAAAWIGVSVACQNLRLATPELTVALRVAAPKLAFASPRHATRLADVFDGPLVTFGETLDEALSEIVPDPAPHAIDPELGVLILYTSGTTGHPKGAVISHRAEIARNLVTRAEYGLRPEHAFVAWAPMYHMGGAEYSIGALISGGEVIVVDGFDPNAIAQLVATRELGWLILMPGMVSRLADTLEAADIRPRGVHLAGVMADLVPPLEIARITWLLGAPYANTFGATETGNPPASAGVIAVGDVVSSLAKPASIFAEIRLVDADGRDVEDGKPGELWMRGPTLFSGYLNDEEATRACFREGWFQMGDVFVRNAEGNLEFVDRVKYLIKSGGESIYPAEIERVMRSDPRVLEVAVVREKDATWGEVPVAFVARRDPALDAEALYSSCREQLARYKQPKAIHFIDVASFPRSTSGKILRHELERRLLDRRDA